MSDNIKAGAENTARALAKSVAAAGLVTATEALLVGKRFGVAPATMLDVVGASSGFSAAVRTIIPEHVLTRKFDSGHRLGETVRGIAAAVDLGRTHRIPTPFAASCLEVWKRVADRYGPEADYTRAVEFLEEKAGERIEGGPYSGEREGSPDTGARPSVGFVGLGVMGAGMAERLTAAGFRVSVFDIDRAKSTAFARTFGAQAAASLAEVGRGSEILITMLPDGHAVRRAVLGDAGGAGDCILAGLAPGAAIVDATSAEPVGTRRLGDDLAKRGIVLLDAPVSIGSEPAREGKMTIMVGGDDAAIERCMPVFRALGKKIVRAGALGTGHAIKACNNTLASAGLAAVTEAVLVAKQQGIAPAAMLDVINASPAANRASQYLMPEQVMSGRYNTGFFMKYQVGNIRGASELATAMGIAAPLFHQSLAMWSKAQAALPPGADYVEAVKYWESEAGVTVAA